MEQLRNDIKTGCFKSSYLLYGDEDYLLRQYKHRLHDALIPDEDSLNDSYFEGKSIVPEEIIALSETLPFFAERRVIVIENSGWFKKPSDQIADYLPGAPQTTCFVFIEREVDKRNRLYKWIQKHGRAVEMKKQTEATLTKWVLGILKREQHTISKSTLELFFSHTGFDMNIVHTELEKLLCYCMDRPQITASDVQAVVSTQTPDHIFRMMDAISARETKQALELYGDLLARREPPLRILALLVRQFHILLKVKLLSREGYHGQALAQQAGLPSFIVRKAEAQAKRFRTRELLCALKQCASTEQAIKTGQIMDKIGVEMLLITCSEANFPAPQS
ncbi:MAG: DNA polymerase III subunit delta [Lachnospiraceae bacterium]